MTRPACRNPNELFKRYSQNPILTAADWPYPINSVFNAGATVLADGTTLLLCRVEDFRGHSHLCAARSADGFTNWKIDRSPTFMPDTGRYPEEIWGLEDPRVTWLEELKQYAIVYTSYSMGGPGVSLATTKNFKTFKRFGVIMPPEDKDAALLPRRVKGRWVLIHRPMGSTAAMGSHIWISCSPDLRHWGSHRLILEARKGGWWDANKIGLSPPPLETADGWLCIYHGVRVTASGSIYRLGLALFDLDRPERCLLRGDTWVFGPQEPCEKSGDVDNVVFPCGYTVGKNGDDLNLYYGAADTCIGVATARIGDLLAWIKKYGKPAAIH